LPTEGPNIDPLTLSDLVTIVFIVISSDRSAILNILATLNCGDLINVSIEDKAILSLAFNSILPVFELRNSDLAELINTVPWDKFLYPQEMKSFMELLLTYDGRPEMALGDFYVYYSKLKEPTEYITNCMHPTQEGYRIIAEELYKYMIKNKYV
jgi:hypothetical protein